jgi:DNA-binding CsgD family transcriptional regulator
MRRDYHHPLDVLTTREAQLLAEMAQGTTDKEVAVALGHTTKTAAKISTAFLPN